MNIVPIPIPINVKDGIVMIQEDSILLHQHQVDLIKTHAIKKTKQKWLSSKSGIKIPLTPQQQQDIVSVKDRVIQWLSPSKDPQEILLQRRGFGFAKHAFERILERVERLSGEELKIIGKRNYQYAIYPETLEEVVGSLIDSQQVKSLAVWNGHPYLNYNFECFLGKRELDIVVNFELGILIVTLVMNRDTGYFVREVYSFENGKAIKKPSPY